MFCDKMCIFREVQLHFSNGIITIKSIIGLLFGLVSNSHTVSRAIFTTGVSINTMQERVNGIKVGNFLWCRQDNMIDGIMSILYYSNNTGKYGVISELIKINTMRMSFANTQNTGPFRGSMPIWLIFASGLALIQLMRSRSFVHHFQVKDWVHTGRSYLKGWHLTANGVTAIRSLNLIFWFH